MDEVLKQILENGCKFISKKSSMIGNFSPQVCLLVETRNVHIQTGYTRWVVIGELTQGAEYGSSYARQILLRCIPLAHIRSNGLLIMELHVV